MLLNELEDKGLIYPPKWLSTNTVYLVTMGSHAYGVANDDSDHDIYGVAVPPKSLVFPHTAGEIPGFGRQIQKFDQYQEAHVIDKDARGGNGIEYDFSVYGIVKYFNLVMNGNPNVVDSLFVPVNCIKHMNHVGSMIRDNRKMFLSKKTWHTYKGYCYSQIAKIDNNKNASSVRRKNDIDNYGFSLKFAYHAVRLLNEVEMILEYQDLDLQRNNDQLKSIRNGEWSINDVKSYFNKKESEIETIYSKSDLRHSPDEPAIKELLVECLKTHYGSLSDEDIVIKKKPELVINEAIRVLESYYE